MRLIPHGFCVDLALRLVLLVLCLMVMMRVLPVFGSFILDLIGLCVLLGVTALFIVMMCPQRVLSVVLISVMIRIRFCVVPVMQMLILLLVLGMNDVRPA